MRQALRPGFPVRSSEIRKLIGIAPATFVDVCRKVGVSARYVLPSDGNGSAKILAEDDVRRILVSRGYRFGARAKILSFMMCKGGVGKTTSSFFVSQRLAAYGARVLAIDADPQGNLTSAFHLERYGLDVDEETPILVDVISGRCSIEEAIVAVSPHLDLLPSTPLNSTLEGGLRSRYGENPRHILERLLEVLRERYDYIVIDCAPTLNLVNAAIICASTTVILPVTLDKFAHLGLEQTLTEIQGLERDFDVAIERKIVLTKFDLRESVCFKYLGDVTSKHKDLLFNTAIRTASEIKTALSNDEDLFKMKRSNGREDYDSFAREIMGLSGAFKKGTAHGRLEQNT